jgi:hypothetical protein
MVNGAIALYPIFAVGTASAASATRRRMSLGKNNFVSGRVVSLAEEKRVFPKRGWSGAAGRQFRWRPTAIANRAAARMQDQTVRLIRMIGLGLTLLVVFRSPCDGAAGRLSCARSSASTSAMTAPALLCFFLLGVSMRQRFL